jgi:UDP-glucose 4-epimerase
MPAKRILVTGAAGKVGQRFIDTLLTDERYADFTVRALIHNRPLAQRPRLEMSRGSIQDQGVVEQAMQGVTHVLHLATCKETPAEIMDVAVKGLFWLLEACRQSSTFEQFILLGGDAAVGHFFYPHPLPVTETQKHTAYPGCYALSKVLEEVMLEQYYVQYALNGCCLRAPWIMEKDDFRWHLSFSEAVFGAPRWCDLVGQDKALEYVRTQTIPVMLDAHNRPLKRNFVHVEDVVSAILTALDHPAARQQTFNIAMNAPVDYGHVGKYLASKCGTPTLEIASEFHSTWLDNSKACHLLGWQPQYDTERLIDAAWDYQRPADDPRVIWYPG